MNLLILVKKELLQFFRNKTDVLTMFLFPIVLIIVMATALKGVMDTDKNIFENKKIYYMVNNKYKDEKYLNVFYNFKDFCEQSLNVKLEKVEDIDKTRNIVNKGDAIAFINIKKDSYDYYMNENKESIEQNIFKNMFEQYLDKYGLIESINYNDIKKVMNKPNLITLKNEGISNSGFDSFTYYTFSILILIILYISGITSISMYNDKSQGTFTRLKISRTNNLTIIASKIILGVIVGILQVIVIYIISNIFMQVNWGEKFIQMLIVLISFITFSSVLGISMSMIFDEIKTANSVINILIIVLGFLGGLYIPISLIKSINIINNLCQFTPTYWANISLLSISSGLSGKYIYTSIFLSLGLSIILITIGLLVKKMKAGGKLA